MAVDRISIHTTPKRTRPPSFIHIWNWLGIVSHGGWFLLMPCILEIPEYWRFMILSALAVPLLLGHLMLYHARMVKRLRGR